MKLSAVEARAVAALVEKERTTPDSYPLTTNALVAACNQQTSRDPVMALTAGEVDAALLELRQRGMVRTGRTTGERTYKHRHTLDQALDLDDEELACVAVLMLRGPQSPGELRQRTDRYVGFGTVATVEDRLRALAGRDEPLVHNLGRRPGQSQDRWIEQVSEHVVDTESADAPAPDGHSSADELPPQEPARAGSADELAALRADVTELRRLVEEIRAELGLTP